MLLIDVLALLKIEKKNWHLLIGKLMDTFNDTVK